jgi:hypothetical protein
MKPVVVPLVDNRLRFSGRSQSVSSLVMSESVKSNPVDTSLLHGRVLFKKIL